MTTELEKQFFDTFGIERKRNHEVTLEAISGGVRSANLSQEPFYEYPQISDRNYLELICELNKLIEKKYGEYETFISFDYENLKEEILRECLFYREELKNQVQAIFKG